MIKINLHIAEAERIKEVFLQSGLFDKIELDTRNTIGFQADVLSITKELPPRVIIIEIKYLDIITQDIIYKLAAAKSQGQKQFLKSTVIAVLVTSGELAHDAAEACKKLNIIVRSVGSIKDGHQFLSELEKPREEVVIPDDVEEMISKLKGIPVGKKNSIQYEETCGEILKYLFFPPLGEPIYQAANALRSNRRDWIFPNHCQTGFWSDIRNLYQGYEIVFDMKNSGVSIQKRSVLEIAHYLTPRGCGMFGILITLKGIGKAGIEAIKDEWIATGRLIMCLTNDDLITMIKAKLRDNHPEQLIERKLVQFRIGI